MKFLEKVDKFVNEHPVLTFGAGVLTIGAIGMVCSWNFDVGYKAGYGAGKVDGILAENLRCCHTFGKDLRNTIEGCVAIGQASVLDAIRDSECGEAVFELTRNNPKPINTIPYILNNPIYKDLVDQANTLMNKKGMEH